MEPQNRGFEAIRKWSVELGFIEKEERKERVERSDGGGGHSMHDKLLTFSSAVAALLSLANVGVSLGAYSSTIHQSLTGKERAVHIYTWR